jgi:RNA polymerase sigma-70 factor (ECF subfamily)
MSFQVVLEREIDAAPERAVDGVPDRRGPDRDHDILDALRRRDPMAVERLVHRYGERAYRLACRITGSGQDAEEVVQDAFWTVVRKIDTFRGESAFGSWLYRIVANGAYQKLRGRQSRRHELSLDEVLPLFDERGCHAAPVADWSQRADDPAIQAEVRAALTAAIDELPAGYRTVLVLRDIEGRSTAHIARDLDLSISVVKTRAHRARLLLRKRLDRCLAALGADPRARPGHRAASVVGPRAS